MTLRTPPTAAEIMALFAKAREARAFLDAFEEWCMELPDLPVMPAWTLPEQPHERKKIDLKQMFGSRTKTDMVLEILATNPHRLFRVRDIVEILVSQGVEFESDNVPASVSSILSRQAKRSNVVQVRRGFWSVKGSAAAERNEREEALIGMAASAILDTTNETAVDDDGGLQDEEVVKS